MKVKEITIGRGRKYSNNYQSVDYHVGITVEGEEDPEKLINYANTNLMVVESHEEIRCKLVIEEIKAEQIADFKKTYNNVTKKIAKDNQFPKETLEVKKPPFATAMIMDLTEVTVIATTEKAILVTKRGYQKWLPFSVIEGGNSGINEGDFLTDIVLTEKGSKWIPDKVWDKLEVRKK